MQHSFLLPAIGAGLSMCLASGPVVAGWANVWTNVEAVLINSDMDGNGDEIYGGCMAKLSVPPSSKLPGCQGDWVTLSCSGDFADPVRAYRMVDQLQLALVANRKVSVHFDDSRKHNGYCYAYRVYLFNQP